MSGDIKADIPSCLGGYRVGVGIVLMNRSGLIFAGHRRDDRKPAWQMPQGGIADGETPFQAVMREIAEELGTDKVTFLHRHADWICYDYPDRKISKRAQDFRGQCHLWHLMRFDGHDSDIDLTLAHGEFSRFEWRNPSRIIEQVIDFKRSAYQRVMTAFSAAIRFHAAAPAAARPVLDSAVSGVVG